jgi:hypothetical protein
MRLFCIDLIVRFIYQNHFIYIPLLFFSPSSFKLISSNSMTSIPNQVNYSSVLRFRLSGGLDVEMDDFPFARRWLSV